MALTTSRLNEEFTRCTNCDCSWFERKTKKRLKKETYSVLETQDFYKCIECGTILKEEL